MREYEEGFPIFSDRQFRSALGAATTQRTLACNSGLLRRLTVGNAEDPALFRSIHGYVIEQFFEREFRSRAAYKDHVDDIGRE